MLKTAIIGIGNILFMDEGIGVYASKYLEKNFVFDDDVEIIDGGTLGFKLMRYYQEYDKVVILDTVSIEDAPGSIYNLPSEVLLGLGEYRKTAHEVEVVEMLEICSMLESIAQVNIIGIVPKDIESVGIGLTDTMRESFDSYIQTLLQELEKNGIQYQRRANKTLDSIIFEYANPSMKECNDITV
ncbi:HyaD/HybD family hydrogenase maturation endopeptidase [Nitratiruptor tergarcus]|uniref:Hydrogenase maturation protease n=1 Tax=Nitratiruptor tergarcus DSM 16512 TaxID=1069081 RepID=A0A1W1WUB2_9BACT|nr:HyaD/HybD family hydrogenase maturation endopeptidase [Nitratiruptor tergarcus]SMC09792.1 hydrogenase maturation protease [Nitratiruptor tergarcus DSM 16512]